MHTMLLENVWEMLFQWDRSDEISGVLEFLKGNII